MDGLVIDNFAGGGGASTGIEAAIGRPVNIAINHDPAAVALHKANHPRTKHYCKNIWQADPQDVVKEAGGGQVGLAWFSPDCKHFSKAKGGRPVKRNIRDLAWIVVLWAKRVRPKIIMLENVEEFQGWGPVLQDGKPCKERKGETFKKWVGELKRLGYKVDWKELRACDYGTPTIRKRLFLIARCDGLPIRWPAPTHGKEGSGLKPYHTAAECIDWDHPCPSIFERKRPLAENTLKRIARGIKKFVIDTEQPFIVSLTHHGQDRVESVEEPFKTITGANRGEKAFVTPYIARIGQTGSNGGNVNHAETPLTTVTTKAEHLLIKPFVVKPNHTAKNYDYFRGQNANEPLQTVTQQPGFALCSAFLAKHFGGVTGVRIDTPLPTVTTRGTQTQAVAVHMERTFSKSVGASIDEPAPTQTAKAHDALVSSHMIKLRGTCRHGAPVTDPMHTITGGGLHLGEVRAFLMKYYGHGANNADLRETVPTLTSKERFGLVTVKGEDYQIVDIGMRMLKPRELFRAQGFPDSYIIDPEFNGKPLTKTAQVRACGNAVCSQIAKALVAENIIHNEPTMMAAE